MDKIECIVIGAGVVGLAVAAQLAADGKEVIVIEQHNHFGEETSSRNSQVIHAGLYYPPNSLKAKTCVRGKELLYQFCDKYHVPYQNTQKLITIPNNPNDQKSHELNLSQLKKLYQNGLQSGVNDLEFLDAVAANQLEPALCAHSAILSPSTGIVDVHEYMRALVGIIESNGGFIVYQQEIFKIESLSQNQISSLSQAQANFVLTLRNYVSNISDFNKNAKTNLDHSTTQIQCQNLIICAGLHSVNLLQQFKDFPKNHIPKQYYCKGSYFSYQGESPFKRLIYPLPSPSCLGIHLCLDLEGNPSFGPDDSWIDEINYDVSFDLKDRFYQSIKDFWPDCNPDKLQPSYSGIRPKLVPQGSPAHDFVIQGPEQHGITGNINLLGIESPGLTSSLALAEIVATLLP